MNARNPVQATRTSPRFQNAEPARPIKFSFTDVFDVIHKLFFDASTRPPAPLPVASVDWSEFTQRAPTLKLIWLGHSTFVLHMAGRTILLDPVFSDSVSPMGFGWKRFQAAPVALADLPQIDFIVISHDHYDHLDEKKPCVVSPTKAPNLLCLGPGRRIAALGHRIHAYQRIKLA